MTMNETWTLALSTRGVVDSKLSNPKFQAKSILNPLMVNKYREEISN
jgi:hypothetical protein